MIRLVRFSSRTTRPEVLLPPWNPGPAVTVRLATVALPRFSVSDMWMRDTTRSLDLGLGWGRGLFLLGLFLIGCATAQHAGERGLPEIRGTASYYAEKFVGRTTANGEVFDQEVLTAAHRSLPFGTRVRVTRIDHFETPSVIVRINDRGPFKRGRIIDLSKKAARRLQMIRDGVVKVKLEVVSYPAGTVAATSDSSKVDSSGTDGTSVAW